MAKKNVQPRYGCALPEPNAQFVPLWWYSISLTKDVARLVSELETQTDEIGAQTDEAKALQQPGIYAFEGKHDSRLDGGILYIGQVGRDVRNPEAVLRKSLKERICESDSKFFWKQGKTDSGLYSDVWDVVLRYAVVNPEILGAVERIMIKAHAPSFNAQLVRGAFSKEDEVNKLVVMNAGSKGRLLPTVAGMYYCVEPWADMVNEYDARST